MADQREYGHIISPLFARHNLSVGETTTGSFTYTNGFTDTKEPKKFTTKVYFLYQEGGSSIIYNEAPSEYRKYDMSNWVEIQNSEFTLNPSEQIQIKYTIDTPLDSQPGGKYAIIVVIPSNEENKVEGANAEILNTIGFPLISRISGTEKLDSEILAFDTDKEIYFRWPQQPVIFTTTAKNNGNVDYLLGGNIFVHKGDITNPTWTATINENDLVILPGNTRSYNNEWVNTDPLVSIKDGSITINTDYFRFGKYTATAKIGYDNNGERLVSDKVTEFWILPIPLIIAILTLALGLYLTIRKWLNKKKK